MRTPGEGFAVLYGYDLTVLSGYPSDLAANFHSMPIIGSGGNPLECGAFCHGSNACVIGAIAHADIDCPIFADNLHI